MPSEPRSTCVFVVAIPSGNNVQQARISIDHEPLFCFVICQSVKVTIIIPSLEADGPHSHSPLAHGCTAHHAQKWGMPRNGPSHQLLCVIAAQGQRERGATSLFMQVLQLADGVECSILQPPHGTLLWGCVIRFWQGVERLHLGN